MQGAEQYVSPWGMQSYAPYMQQYESDNETHDLFKEALLVTENDCQDIEVNCAYCLGLVYKGKECDECNTPYC